MVAMESERLAVELFIYPGLNGDHETKCIRPHREMVSGPWSRRRTSTQPLRNHVEIRGRRTVQIREVVRKVCGESVEIAVAAGNRFRRELRVNFLQIRERDRSLATVHL